MKNSGFGRQPMPWTRVISGLFRSFERSVHEGEPLFSPRKEATRLLLLRERAEKLREWDREKRCWFTNETGWSIPDLERLAKAYEDRLRRAIRLDRNRKALTAKASAHFRSVEIEREQQDSLRKLRAAKRR